MRTYLQCIPCFAQQILDAAAMACQQEAARRRVVRRCLRALSQFPEDGAPPAMAARLHRVIRRETGRADPYAEVKRRANAFALELLPRMRRIVADADDPFQAALRLAIAGNLMDWGAGRHADTSDRAVVRALEQALEAPLEPNEVEELRRQTAAADRILYLADNAGEVAFDRLLIEQLPVGRVTVAVRGAPIINDATREDARRVGLDEVARLVDNGADVPGTDLAQCSPEFRRLFEQADVIIAKGQGNYETLSDRPENIWFLLKVKCPVVAQDAGREHGDTVLMRRR